MKRPETTGADISTANKSEELISLLDEYCDHIEAEGNRHKENVKIQVERLLLITRLLDYNSSQLPETFRTELSELIKEMALSYKTLIQ